MTDTTRDLAALSVWPILGCRDARAIAAFLVDALGFEDAGTTVRDGIVIRAELRWPNGLGGVLLREPHPTYPSEESFRNAMPDGPSAVYVMADDVEAGYRRAKEAGADVVRPLEDIREGLQGFAVRDPEGNVWSFANRSFG